MEMTIEEIRLRNLRALIQRFGTIATVAEKANTAPAYLSQITNRAPSRTGKPRDMGSALARKIEAGCGLSTGWMDTDHGEHKMTEMDKQFVHQVEENLARYDVPDHIRQTIITLLENAPTKEGS